MDDAERERLVAWLVAEFEVQNGIDVTKDKDAIQRLREQAERAASSTDKYEVNLPFLAADKTGPKHFHVVLARSRIDDILSGREGPPHIVSERRSAAPEEPEARASEPPKSEQSSSTWLIVAVIVALAGGAIAFAYAQSSKHDHDGHGQEHKH